MSSCHIGFSPGFLRGHLTTSTRHVSFFSPGRIQSPPGFCHRRHSVCLDPANRRDRLPDDGFDPIHHTHQTRKINAPANRGAWFLQASAGASCWSAGAARPAFRRSTRTHKWRQAAYVLRVEYFLRNRSAPGAHTCHELAGAAGCVRSRPICQSSWRSRGPCRP